MLIFNGVHRVISQEIELAIYYAFSFKEPGWEAPCSNMNVLVTSVQYINNSYPSEWIIGAPVLIVPNAWSAIVRDKDDYRIRKHARFHQGTHYLSNRVIQPRHHGCNIHRYKHSSQYTYLSVSGLLGDNLSNSDCISLNDWMINELGKDVKGMKCGRIWGTISSLPRRAGKSYEKLQDNQCLSWDSTQAPSSCKPQPLPL